MVRHRASGTGPVVASRPVRGGARDGKLTFSTHGLAPGRYDVELKSAARRMLARTSFWVYAASSRSMVTTSRRTYKVGQNIGVGWTRAPGMGLDWIGIFCCSTTTCDGNDGYLLYTYTRTKIQGHGTIGASSATLEGAASWPLPPGTYVARLVVDDNYLSIGRSARFKVRAT